MRFLIIDDSPSYRGMLRYNLTVAWPDAVIEEHQPAPGSWPDGLILSNYDLIMLGHPVADAHEFEWLGRLRCQANCPPVLLFAEPSDEFLAVDAIKAGASSFFPKSQVKHERLIETVRAELGTEQHGPGTDAAHHDMPVLGPRDYRFLERLHSSDLVSVYLAKAENGRQMACKVIQCLPDSGSERLFDRFLQEYEVIARIDHPNVVHIFDLGIADDHAYIAMEYLSAGSLAERLKGEVNVELVLEYSRQIGSALEAIHESGVLHRDLKPANIMFRKDETLALIDFGLAKQMKLHAAITYAGQISGTPYYMSPEQGHAEPADERSDIYSFGCIFYEMLTGARPFTASSAMGVIYKHANATRPKLEGALKRLQAPLDRMLAIKREERYQSATELLEGLSALG